MLIKNKNSEDYTETVRSVYKLLADKFGYLARITDIWNLLATSFNLDKFEILNPKFYRNVEFESYLIDNFIEFRDGKDINFTNISDSIKKVGDFTVLEKLMFDSGNIDERVWAIYLFIYNPSNEKLK